jgi:hypothetical protein
MSLNHPSTKLEKQWYNLGRKHERRRTLRAINKEISYALNEGFLSAEDRKDVLEAVRDFITELKIK